MTVWIEEATSIYHRRAAWACAPLANRQRGCKNKESDL